MISPVSGGQDETIQFGVRSSGPPAGSPDIRHTFLTPSSPASCTVACKVDDCRAPSIGWSWLLLALRAISSSPRLANASTKRWHASALATRSVRFWCGAADQLPVFSSTPANAELDGGIQHRLESEVSERVRDNSYFHADPPWRTGSGLAPSAPTCP